MSAVNHNLTLSSSLSSGSHVRSRDENDVGWATLRGKAEKACLKDRHFTDKSQDNDCSIYFVHNHKAGGTTLCNIAVQAGLRVAKPVRNCLEPDELRGAGREDQLVQYIESNHLQFVAHEFGPFLPLTHFSSHIVYVTVVRNPWDRVLSAAHHDLCQKTPKLAREAAAIRHCHFDPLTATAADIVLDPCFRRSFSSVNHYVNKFSPCPTPKGSGGVPDCGPQQLQDALRLLELVSAVIVTDSPATYERSFPVLTAMVPQMKYETSLRAGTTAHSDAKYLLRHNETAWATLVGLNTEDYRFYKHALALADLQLKKLQEKQSPGVSGSSRLRGHLQGGSAGYQPVDDRPYAFPPGENEAARATQAPLELFCSF